MGPFAAITLLEHEQWVARGSRDIRIKPVLVWSTREQQCGAPTRSSVEHQGAAVWGTRE